MPQRAKSTKSQPSKSKKPRQDSDSPWKKMLRHHFPKGLDFFFPDVAALIDWSRSPEFLDKEFEQLMPKSARGKRYADKLVRVWLLDGTEKYLLLHIEIQARKEDAFPERMLIYSIRIFDHYGVLATSLAVLCDSNLTWRPTHCELNAPMTQLSFRFAAVKLLDFADDWDALDQSDNPFAWIVKAHLKTQATKRDPKSRKAWKFTLMRQLYDRGMPAQEIRDLYEFVDWTMMLPEALEDEFWRELKTLEESQNMPYVTNAERIGIKQGIEQGIELTTRELALKMLRRGMDLETIAEITGLSQKQLQQLQAS
jgi:hypothetical protein